MGSKGIFIIRTSERGPLKIVLAKIDPIGKICWGFVTLNIPLFTFIFYNLMIKLDFILFSFFLKLAISVFRRNIYKLSFNL